jgi:hypothetical protein
MPADAGMSLQQVAAMLDALTDVRAEVERRRDRVPSPTRFATEGNVPRQDCVPLSGKFPAEGHAPRDRRSS